MCRPCKQLLGLEFDQLGLDGDQLLLMLCRFHWSLCHWCRPTLPGAFESRWLVRKVHEAADSRSANIDLSIGILGQKKKREMYHGANEIKIWFHGIRRVLWCLLLSFWLFCLFFLSLRCGSVWRLDRQNSRNRRPTVQQRSLDGPVGIPAEMETIW